MLATHRVRRCRGWRGTRLWPAGIRGHQVLGLRSAGRRHDEHHRAPSGRLLAAIRRRGSRDTLCAAGRLYERSSRLPAHLRADRGRWRDVLGQNSHGEIGDGTLNDRTTPVDVCASGSGGGCGGGAALAGISAVTAGAAYSCAIAAAGDARCWGSNSRGRLGDGTTFDRENPVGVFGLTGGVTTIAGGAVSGHACAAKDDGSLSCWGSNSNGQVGVGNSDVDDHTTPEEVTGFAPKITPTPTASDTPTSTPTVLTNTPAPGETPEPTATPGANGLIGDVDCNGEINAIDAAFLLQFVTGLIDELPYPENADVNENGSTDTIDAALILQFSAGLLNMLPP